MEGSMHTIPDTGKQVGCPDCIQKLLYIFVFRVAQILP